MNLASKSEIICQDGVTAMPQYAEGTPIEAGDVSRWNQSQDIKSARAFDIEVKAAAAVSLSAAELWGVAVEVDSFVAKTISSVANASEQLTITSHGLLTGHGPIRVASDANDLPLGLDADTDYFVIKVDANTIQLASSRVNAFAETAVTFDDDGSGNLSLTVSPNTTYRPRLLSYGLLGAANDGAIECDDYLGWTTRINHRPRTVAYFMTATLSGAVATTMSVHVVAED